MSLGMAMDNGKKKRLGESVAYCMLDMNKSDPGRLPGNGCVNTSFQLVLSTKAFQTIGGAKINNAAIKERNITYA
jgi:hypothetical protein